MPDYDVWLDNPTFGQFVGRFTSEQLSRYLVRRDVDTRHKDRLQLMPVDANAPRYKWIVTGIDEPRTFYIEVALTHHLMQHYYRLDGGTVRRIELRRNGRHCWYEVATTVTDTNAYEWLHEHLDLPTREVTV